MKKYFILIAWLLSASSHTMAQRSEIYSSNITTLQVVAGADWQSMPITQLGGNAIHIDFDELSHTYRRLSYRIIHCDADWQESQDIFESDYLQGFNGELLIDDTEQSINTNHLYTHYHLSIPNENIRLTMSGNYKVVVYDDNAEDNAGGNTDGNAILSACFMVVDPKVDIALRYDSNTDIDVNRSHQQVSFKVNYKPQGNTLPQGRTNPSGSMQQLGIRVSDPAQQIKTVVLQNGRWDNAVFNPKPDYVSADGLQWLHCKQLIFPAGNVYRKFELLDLDHPTMGVDEIRWDGKQYHAFVVPDEPRPSYVHDVSAQGSYYVRNSDNIDNSYTCDYALVHFTLKAPKQASEVYINGDWTQDRFLPQYLMRYDDTDKCYHASLLLKQGYYSYQYLLLKEDDSTLPIASEGCFAQTENKYDVLVYYRGRGERADQLVGWKRVK